MSRQAKRSRTVAPSTVGSHEPKSHRKLIFRQVPGLLRYRRSGRGLHRSKKTKPIPKKIAVTFQVAPRNSSQNPKTAMAMAELKPMMLPFHQSTRAFEASP